jgi:thioesterase domain-containing protein
VAFETARLLTEAKHKVDLVVMIDPMVGSIRRWGRIKLMAVDLICRLRRVSDDRRRQSLRLAWQNQTKAEVRAKRGKDFASRILNKSWSERGKALGRFVSRTLQNHPASERKLVKPKAAHREVIDDVHPLNDQQKALIEAYECAFSVYRPEPLAVPVFYIGLHYSGRGWQRMTSNLEIVDFEAHHYDCLSGESAPIIVDCLRERLNRAPPFSASLR